MKAFLSHASADKPLVGVVQKKLTSQNAWYDAVDIELGDSIPEKISDGLRHATHFVLFWSQKAKDSSWVKAELNAAFVQMMANKCKFLVFLMDDTPLPILLQPYKYSKVDMSEIASAAEEIVTNIMKLDGPDIHLTDIINRTAEIGEIEDAVRENYKIIFLHGLRGIGKASLAKKAMKFLYDNRASNLIILDFNNIPGIAELSVELSRYTKCRMKYDNTTLNGQKNNIAYFIEKIIEMNLLLVLLDVKRWLDEDGTLGENLRFITDYILKQKSMNSVVVITSSRYVQLPYEYIHTVKEIPVRGMDDKYIATIIKNNLLKSFASVDEKNIGFAKRLYGYPLGAKIAAYHISNLGYDYYLSQPEKFSNLTINIAKEFITYADIPDECQHYLKIVALAKGRLRNEEYVKVFPKLKSKISGLADKAFFAGIINYAEDGCYKFEPLAEDYFYSLAFNDHNRKKICSSLEKYLLGIVEDGKTSNEDYMRLIPATVHILTLNGKVDKAKEVRSELTQTIISAMWDKYNHIEYEDALGTAESLLDGAGRLPNQNDDATVLEAFYMKALCLTRFDKYSEAEKILNALLKCNPGKNYLYYYGLGRVQKKKGDYNSALALFQMSNKHRHNFLSSLREIADCYIYMERFDEADKTIQRAKKIDEGNLFLILLEALLLQKRGRAKDAIDLLSTQSLMERKPEQILFRKGRAYDQLGETEKACSCYKEALSYNNNAHDAKLCLLNHQIFSAPQEVKADIDMLRKKLRGKRLAILTNIEARYIGYQEDNESEAIALLGKVEKQFRDRQWYAVNMQMLEKIINKNKSAGLQMLVDEYTDDLEHLKEELSSKYGKTSLEAKDLLPDR